MCALPSTPGVGDETKDAGCEIASHASACVVNAYARDFKLDDIDLGFCYLHRAGYLCKAI